MENNKRFDVIQFYFIEIDQGIKRVQSEIDKFSPFSCCALGHMVHSEFYGTDLVRKVLYSREFNCVECKKICSDILNTVGNWIPGDKHFAMKLNVSFIEKKSND